MSVFSPKRYQRPFRPVHPDPWLKGVFTAFERAVKSLLFSCRMCGNCILQETAFVCPMTCAKGMRNGPCGGATPEHCEVEPSRPCTWYLIYERAERLGRTDRLLEVQAPLDGLRTGHETWIDLLAFWRKRRQGTSLPDLLTHRARFAEEWERLFYELREPDWWQGDALYHPPAYEEPVSFLEASLRTGTFVTTAEIAPPLGASPKLIQDKANLLRGYITAANLTDNASASARVNSLASSKMCLDAGIEPVLQLQARDRSRVVIQADAMGAAGLGLQNVLCLTGDHHCFGMDPISTPNQFDLDAIQILWTLRRLRDEGRYLDGRTTRHPPSLFLGAAASPFGIPPKYEAIRTEKKINAGAQFIQTQPVFDHDRFIEWLEALDKRDLLDKVHVLAGLVPLKSARAVQFMTKVPGVLIPSEVIERMERAGGREGQQEEGVTMALEMIEKLKHTAGISGMHVMAVHWEEIVPRLVEESGLPKPVFRRSLEEES
jgi:methylenetetrahydrofolate reductase (NADPH)